MEVATSLSEQIQTLAYAIHNFCCHVLLWTVGISVAFQAPIVPRSRVVRCQIEIQDMCDKSAAQELADLRTIDLRAKAGAYYSKRTTRYSPNRQPSL
jgi:hypothetical protein